MSAAYRKNREEAEKFFKRRWQMQKFPVSAVNIVGGGGKAVGNIIYSRV